MLDRFEGLDKVARLMVSADAMPDLEGTKSFGYLEES